MNEQVSKTVTEILVNKIGLEESEITPDANFIKDLGIDSLDFAELIMEFEQAFDIKINDDDAAGLATISEVLDFIQSKVDEEK
jgi:acyl carrier protein